MLLVNPDGWFSIWTLCCIYTYVSLLRAPGDEFERIPLPPYAWMVHAVCATRTIDGWYSIYNALLGNVLVCASCLADAVDTQISLSDIFWAIAFAIHIFQMFSTNFQYIFVMFVCQSYNFNISTHSHTFSHMFSKLFCDLMLNSSRFGLFAMMENIISSNKK